ncbi:hypothetical protein D3C73_1014900 [compost metagenome]
MLGRISQRLQVAVGGGVQAQDAQADRRPGIGGQGRPPQHDGNAVDGKGNASLLFDGGIKHGAVAAAHIHPCHRQHLQQGVVGQPRKSLCADVVAVDGVADVASLLPTVHIDVYVAGALRDAPADDIQKQGGQARGAFGLRPSAAPAQSRRRQLPPGDHQQQRCGQRIARRFGQAVSRRNHHALQLVDGIALNVFLDGENCRVAVVQHHRTEPAGQRGQIKFTCQRTRKGRIQPSDVISGLQRGRHAGFQRRGRRIHG